MSARPASVALTVVVPPTPQSDVGLASEGEVSLVRATSTTIDFDTMVALSNGPMSRLEVRLGAAWQAEPTYVLIQNHRGEFERLPSNGDVVAFDAYVDESRTRWPLRFRLESNKSFAGIPLAIPIEYRLIAGHDDMFSVWSFRSVLRLDSGR